MTPACFVPVLDRLRAALREANGPVIAAIDGRCASGKTTLAALCAQTFHDCSVFHMDDFFLPYEMRTPERLSTPGGNVDHERIKAEVLEPLSRGEAVTFSRFDCSAGTREPPRTVPPTRLSILEGSYSLHPRLVQYSQVRIFLTCSPQVQLERLARRETAESLENFRTRWIPMEEAYFSAFDTAAHSDLVIDTADLAPGP